MESLEVICSLLIIGYAVYHYFFSSPKFWKNRGVPGPKPHPLFGNLKNVICLKQSMSEFVKEVCDDFPEKPVIGIYTKKDPVLLVKDLDLIKDILVKDFSKFAHRGTVVNAKVDPLYQHLFHLEPEKWRPMRTKLTPVFTAAKLKDMFYIVQECCDFLHTYLDHLIDRREPIEVRELTAKYATDVIGSCVFGLKLNALSDEDCEFRKMGRKIFATSRFKVVKFFIRDNFPKIYGLLAFIFRDKQVNEFFINTIKQTMDYRAKENIMRHDFVDVLRELKSSPNMFEMTDTLLTAQAYVFFVAGFQTSSTTLSHILYELAQHLDIQNRLRSEIMTELEKCEGKLNFENIGKMKYLNQVYQETLRKYPVVPTLIRESGEPYTFRGTQLTIPSKQKIWIPVYSIHHDPIIYPNPNTFDPDRFTEKAKQGRHQMSYLPFGSGPRNCIAERFAMYEIKACLSKVIEYFQVDVCEQTVIPYKQNPAAVILSPINGIYLKFIRLKK